MLNEGKVKLLTKLAVYEKSAEGKKNISIRKNFKSDYVSFGIIKTILAATIAYLMCVAVYVLCNVQFYVENILYLDYTALFYTIGKYYLLVVIVFGLISFLYYTYVFEVAKKDTDLYISRLKKLERYYEKEDEVRRRVGGNKK